MIKEFDKKNLNNLRSDFDHAVAEVAKKYGIAIRLGTLRYDGVKATSKIEFVVTTAPDGTSTTNSQEALRAADFSRYASSFGLKPEQYGTIFKHGRDTYKLVGIKPRSSVYPILATNIATGTTYKLPESAIAGLQSDDHKQLFGGGTKTPTASGMCSNDNAYSNDGKYTPIGKCDRAATTHRKDYDGRTQPYCAKCAELIDESRAEMRAEARANR